MTIANQIEAWSQQHQSKFLSVVRMALGLVIALKGAMLMQNNEQLLQMVQNSHLSFFTFIIVHYINMVHIPAGLLITAGLITRIAILFQLPIMIGAVLFINLPQGMLAGQSELILSLLVLVLMAFFFFYGAGPWSVDQILKKQKQ